MGGPWISDEREDPPIPLGLNEMTIPRAAILASIGTIAILLLSVIWVGWGAYVFVGQLDKAFATVDEDSLKQGDRWSWEVMLLFETCEPRDDAWAWPENLSAQDEPFWLPGELSCEWEHQGSQDRAVFAINNAGNETLDLQVSLSTENVIVTHPSGGVVSVEPDTAELVALQLTGDIEEETFVITVAHATVSEARVELEVHLLADSASMNLHSSPGQRMTVHYQVWIYDTGEDLDEGDLPATAGEDPMCDTGAPWLCYIKGFGWGLVGLDCMTDRCLLFDGSTHRVLLPPELAYKDRPDREPANNQWLLFELSINELYL
jgi:hypothetical protein